MPVPIKKPFQDIKTLSKFSIRHRQFSFLKYHKTPFLKPCFKGSGACLWTVSVTSWRVSCVSFADEKLSFFVLIIVHKLYTSQQFNKINNHFDYNKILTHLRTICLMYISSTLAFSCPKSQTRGNILWGSGWTRYTNRLIGTLPENVTNKQTILSKILKVV